MKDYAQHDFNNLSQSRFNRWADRIMYAVGTAALIYLGWLIGYASQAILMFNF